VLRAMVRRGVLPQAAVAFQALEYACLRRAIRLNGFRFNGDMLEGERGYDVGEVIFDRISRINHSCVPNLQFDLVWSEALGAISNSVVATAEIGAGDELTISYVPQLMPLAQRRPHLKKHWGFDCDCPRCHAELAMAEATDCPRCHAAPAEVAKATVPQASEEGRGGASGAEGSDAGSSEAGVGWDDLTDPE